MPPKKALKRKEPFPSSSSEKQPKRARNEKETPLDWLELPRDMTASIPRRLGAIEILETAQKACMSWRNLCKDPTVWHAVDMCNSCNCIRELRRLPYDLKNSNPRLESCCPKSLITRPFAVLATNSCSSPQYSQVELENWKYLPLEKVAFFSR